MLQRGQSQQPGRELGCSEHTARVCRKPEPVGARGLPGQSLDSHQDDESSCVMAKIFCAVQQTLPEHSQEKRAIQCRAAGQRDIWTT